MQNVKFPQKSLLLKVIQSKMIHTFLHSAGVISILSHFFVFYKLERSRASSNSASSQIAGEAPPTYSGYIDFLNNVGGNNIVNYPIITKPTWFCSADMNTLVKILFLTILISETKYTLNDDIYNDTGGLCSM